MTAAAIGVGFGLLLWVDGRLDAATRVVLAVGLAVLYVPWSLFVEWIIARHAVAANRLLGPMTISWGRAEPDLWLITPRRALYLYAIIAISAMLLPIAAAPATATRLWLVGLALTAVLASSALVRIAARSRLDRPSRMAYGIEAALLISLVVAAYWSAESGGTSVAILFVAIGAFALPWCLSWIRVEPRRRERRSPSGRSG